MPGNLTPANWLARTKTIWGLLMQVAVFVFGIAGSFLLPPPGWASSTGDKTIVRLGQFIIAMLAGLTFLLVQKWNKKKHVSRWAMLAIVFLILSLVAYFFYQQLLDRRTCQCLGQAVVIGTDFTEHGREQIRENPNSNCSILLEDHACNAEDVWTADSINMSRYYMTGLYILNLPLLTVCIIAVVQALYCSQAKTRAK